MICLPVKDDKIKYTRTLHPPWLHAALTLNIAQIKFVGLFNNIVI